MRLILVPKHRRYLKDSDGYKRNAKLPAEKEAPL